ncbi:MAG: hypothetical protein ACLSG5_08575 [Oscillospiraceae bacterium]
MLADSTSHGFDPQYGSDYVNLQLIYKNQPTAIRSVLARTRWRSSAFRWTRRLTTQ